MPFWIFAQALPAPTTADLTGPYAALVLALVVIAALAKAFTVQRAEIRELNDRVFKVVEKVEPVLHEVAGALKESTRAVERSGQGRDR